MAEVIEKNTNSKISEYVGMAYNCPFEMAIHQFSAIKNGTKKVDPIQYYVYNDGLGMIGNPSSWCIEVIPCEQGSETDTNPTKENFVQIFFYLESSVDIKLNARCSASVVNGTGHILDYDFEVKGGKYCSQGWPTFLNHSQVTGSQLSNDCLRIKGDIQFTVLAGGEPRHPRVSASVRLAELLKSGTGSDFVLIASDGLEIPVRKSILAAQSNVFAAMFQHDFTEVKSGKCKVDDTDGNTLNAMVSFMYGTNDWDVKLAEKILAAANKYEIAGLEEDAVGVLLDQLTTENAASLLKLADTHSLDGMERDIVKFIVDELDEFIGAGGFQQLKPALVMEILDEAYERKLANRKV